MVAVECAVGRLPRGQAPSARPQWLRSERSERLETTSLRAVRDADHVGAVTLVKYAAVTLVRRWMLEVTDDGRYTGAALALAAQIPVVQDLRRDDRDILTSRYIE